MQNKNKKTHDIKFMKKTKSRGKWTRVYLFFVFYISPKQEANIYYIMLKREKVRKDLLS